MSLSRSQYDMARQAPRSSVLSIIMINHHAARRIPSGQERASRRPRRPAADRALCGPAHGHTRDTVPRRPGVTCLCMRVGPGE